MNAQMDIQILISYKKQLISYQKNIHILVNIFSVAEILTDITDYIKTGEYIHVFTTQMMPGDHPISCSALQ